MKRKYRVGPKVEIERKFLIQSVPQDVVSFSEKRIVQGYITGRQDKTEVRLRKKGDESFLTVKSGQGLAREETEVELSKKQFNTLWPLTKDRRIEKIRYEIRIKGAVVELDIYQGPLEGLKIAEIEFPSVKESESFEPPDWFSSEVTEDESYKNKNLAGFGLPEKRDK